MEPCFVNYAGTAGGLFLILGAFYLNKGNLLWSVFYYFIADCMWVILAFRQEDYFGMVSIIIGMTLGVLVFIKSHKGEFVKNLKIEKET